MTFSEEVVAQAERALERLRSALRPLQGTSSSPASPAVEEALRNQVETSRLGFLESMDDDFNTAGALGYLFDLVRAINTARDAGAPAQALSAAQGALREWMGVLGLRIERPENGGHSSAQAAPFIDLLVEVRCELRQAKQFALADSIRARLAGLGVTLEDSREGTHWKFEG